MVTNAGGGYSRCARPGRHALARGFHLRRRGPVLLYTRSDERPALVRRPSAHRPAHGSVRGALLRRQGRVSPASMRHIATSLEIAVSPQDSAEVRRVTLTNHDSTAHELELTSYAEVVLAPHGADLAHPAFGKLFLETEWLPTHAALFCRRRPRAPEAAARVGRSRRRRRRSGAGRRAVRNRSRPLPGPRPHDGRARGAGFEGRPVRHHRRRSGPRSSACGLRVAVPPGSSASVAFTTAVALTPGRGAGHWPTTTATTRPSLRVFDLAWAHCQVELRHLRLSTEEAHLYQRLASHLIYAGPALRAAPPCWRPTAWASPRCGGMAFRAIGRFCC